jgi:DNA-directed RNA polymerase omega subunit
MSKPIGLSRGPEVDTDVCVANVGNRYNLVLVAVARAREIKRQHKDSMKREHVYSNITALLDVQSGKVGVEYLKRVR